MLLVKYRFYRRDSPRGTTQASVTFGPKIPKGKTDLTDGSGSLLPASLQPGSGWTDFFPAVDWTYTGLFNFKRLAVAAEAEECRAVSGPSCTQRYHSFHAHPDERKDLNPNYSACSL